MTMQSFAHKTQNAAAAGPEPVQETLGQALVRPSERRVFTHDGCGGWVLFDLQGGYCIACGARPLRAAEYSKPE
jgi:hypothetical protein